MCNLINYWFAVSVCGEEKRIKKTFYNDLVQQMVHCLVLIKNIQNFVQKNNELEFVLVEPELINSYFSIIFISYWFVVFLSVKIILFRLITNVRCNYYLRNYFLIINSLADILIYLRKCNKIFAKNKTLYSVRTGF